MDYNKNTTLLFKKLVLLFKRDKLNKKAIFTNSLFTISPILVIVLLFILAGIFYFLPLKKCSNDFNFCKKSLTLTPWENIGGCGASSGSVSGASQLKWIGKGVSGGLFNVELFFMQAMLSDTAQFDDENNSGWMKIKNTSFITNISFKRRFLDFKLSLPFVYKDGLGTRTGLLGDMSFDVGLNWGSSVFFNSALSFGFPTGRYRIHVPGSNARYVLPEMQLGSGVFSISPRFQVTVDRDWGILTGGFSYSMGMLAVKTDTYGYDSTADRIERVKRSLQISRDEFGAINDIGNKTPDAFSLFYNIGIKREGVVHGFDITYSDYLSKGSYDQWEKRLTRWSAFDSTSDEYFRNQASAQFHADTLGLGTNELEYESPIVAGYTSAGRWVVYERIKKSRNAPSSLSIQYSLEKNDMNVPLLFGGIIKFDFDDGIRLGSLALGMGIKFGVF